MQENLTFEKMGLQEYKPHFKFEIDTTRYRLKVADCFDQLLELFAFRQRVFFGLDSQSIFDFDEYDSQCDHIIVTDKETNSICGTYRIALSSQVASHYSQLEFHLDEFLARPGIKMELGRAAIASEHRNGSVLDLLWYGLAEYAKQSQAQFLFGCSSVMTMDEAETMQIFNELKSENYLIFNWGIKPTEFYSFDFERNSSDGNPEFSAEIPPLLLSYLKAGSKVYGRPAIDRDFGCIDFMTILDVKDLTRFYKKRYFRENA